MDIVRVFPDVDSSVYSIRLGESEYKIRLEWYGRLSCWLFSAWKGEDLLVSGRSLERFKDLFSYCNPRIAPQRRLMLLGDERGEIPRESLGERSLVVFLDEEFPGEPEGLEVPTIE